MKRIFVNLTRHQLTESQLKRIDELGFNEVYNLDDIITDETVKNLLLQSPKDLNLLKAIAKSVRDQINKKFDTGKLVKDIIYVQLPVGSPLQQVLLFLELIQDFNIVYSYSKRKNGGSDDETEFEFEDFIIISKYDLDIDDIFDKLL